MSSATRGESAWPAGSRSARSALVRVSPANGIGLAELIAEGRSSLVDITPFRPGRFAEGQPWRDPHVYAESGDVLTISR